MAADVEGLPRLLVDALLTQQREQQTALQAQQREQRTALQTLAERLLQHVGASATIDNVKTKEAEHVEASATIDNMQV